VRRLRQPVNGSPIINAIVQSRYATMHELDTVYGVRDAYQFIELIAVDSFNSRLMNEPD
jgi:hypothetical protein